MCLCVGHMVAVSADERGHGSIVGNICDHLLLEDKPAHDIQRGGNLPYQHDTRLVAHVPVSLYTSCILVTQIASQTHHVATPRWLCCEPRNHAPYCRVGRIGLGAGCEHEGFEESDFYDTCW